MTKISQYPIISNPTEQDILIGTDANNYLVTKNFELGDLREFMISGLSPELGGILLITEVIRDESEDYSTPAEVLNSLNPVLNVLRYNLVIVSILGDKYLLKLQNVTVGIGEDPVLDSDFIVLNKKYSVGDGTSTYKGFNATTQSDEFRSVKSTGLNVSTDGNNILVNNKQGENLGNGVDVYDGLNGTTNVHKFKGLTSTGLDITTNTTDVNLESKAGVSLGDSTEVYKGLNATSKLHEFYDLKSSNLVIRKETVDSVETGNILIELNVDPSDIKFYVNANYEGGNSNGSLTKPFVYLKDAFTAFIGTGSIITPQYAGVGTIELLSDVTVLETGPSSMDYLSVNFLRVKGNGYTITYEGTQEYFISTAYLVGLCSKTSGRLDFPISMSFENVTIESEKVHEIVYNLNYTSPTVTGSQNAVGMSFKNCQIVDKAFLSEESSYTSTGISLFGQIVKVQNGSVLSKTRYTVKNENINWFGDGNLQMSDCAIFGSSSTILYNLNSTFSTSNLELNFNPYYVNYGTLTSGIYSPMTGISFIYNHNDTGGVGTNNKRAENYMRIENFKELTQEASSGTPLTIIGGADSFYKSIGKNYFEIANGSFFSERVNNLIQLDLLDSTVNLNNFNCNNLQIADNTRGAFKYIGSSTPASRIFTGVNGSVINNVKYDASLLYILPVASSATINGADFTSARTYLSNAEALSLGLIPGNIYFNNSNEALRVI